jgi:VIT1/CCC1 family predicted Fe2+/Mn2+ transporter
MPSETDRLVQPVTDISDTAVNVDDTSSIDSHAEPHFGSAEVVRDVIIGLSDGLTVPFALAAGLATLDSSRLVLTAGIAEVVAGSISMALGGYLAGLSEIEHYDNERKREAWEVEYLPEREEEEIVEIFEPYGISEHALQPLIRHLKANKETWVDFMMKFELNLERPEPNRSWISALTIGVSYFLGGVIPLTPYALFPLAKDALTVSAGVTIFALFIFGYVKSRMLGNARPFVGAIQMMLVGSLAAACAYGVAQFIPQDIKH